MSSENGHNPHTRSTPCAQCDGEPRKFMLMTDKELQRSLVALSKSGAAPIITALMLEVREYRKLHGPLGCEWLALEIDK